MSLNKSKKHWEDMGDLDPYWAILTSPDTKHGKWDIDKFFGTGSEEISSLLHAGEKLGLPKHHDCALDFGCGVGRLTRALAPHFRNVVGIDISQSMLRQAEALNPLPNCRFVLNDSDSLPFPAGQFDLIYTALVLQHVPDKESIRRYIAEFLRVLKTGGFLVMQLPSYVPLRRRLQARPRIYGWLRSAGVSEQVLYNKLGLHPIPMNFLPESEVVSIIRAGGGTTLQISADHRAGHHIPARVYCASKNG
jgi:SAM-dependent methyltransferase